MNKKLPTQQTARSGFTLLELMVVIVIIAILMALILPSIFGVLGNARNAEVSSDLTQLDQALTTFKSKFGEYPPSYLHIPAAGGTWNAKSRAAVRAIWPQFDFSSNGGLGNTTEYNLSGAECLVFFLGGVESGAVGTASLSGFSRNPLTPWAPSGESDGPFMEFKFDRLVDVDGDNLFEYVDALPDQSTPILYLSGAGRSMNKDNDNLLQTLPPTNATLTPAQDDYDVFGDSRDMSFAYFKSNDQVYNKDTFQLISPGDDGQYGTGGPYVDAVPPGRLNERDNITNFSGGTLN